MSKGVKGATVCFWPILLGRVASVIATCGPFEGIQITTTLSEKTVVGAVLFHALAKQLRSCVCKVRAIKRLNKNAMPPE